MGFKIQLRRGLRNDLPTLDNGELGYTTDTNELFIGTTDYGNKKLVFTTDAAKVADEYEWTASDGQLTYVFPTGKTYDPNSKWLEVVVGGAPVPDSQIQKDNDTQFTLLMDSSKIQAGMSVFARWTDTFIPVDSQHHTTHELGGYDEIDITNLKNYQEKVATQLADIAKLVSNYKTLALNVGQSNEDWSPAIQQAINDVNSLGGGKVLLPSGNIQVLNPVTIYSGTTIEGNSRNYHGGSRITIGGNNSWAFFIGENTHDVIFRNFVIDGRGLSNGNIGFLCKGGYPNSSYRITFDELQIYGMDKCVQVLATDTNKNWQCDNVLFNHCQFVESNYGIYGDAMNFDYVKVLNCVLGCLHNIYVLHGGRLNIDSCSASYTPDIVNSEFIHMERVGTVVVQSSQCESMGYFLVYTDGTSSNPNPLTLIGNIINSPINFHTTRPVTSIGNYYTANFSFMDNAGDCTVTSMNDNFSSGNKWVPYINTTIQYLGYGETQHIADYISDYNPNGFPVNVTNQLLTDTNNDIILNVRTKPNGNYILYVYYTVITASTNVSLTAGWNDIQTGHQSKVLDSGSKAVGSYTLTPLFINNTGDAGTQTVSLQVQAGTANQVYVSASLVKL